MDVTYHSGYDIFTPDAGEEEKMSCRCCGANMDVKRNIQRRTKYEGKILEGQFADHFTCPHAGEEWHNQIINIMEWCTRCPLQSLAVMAEKEIAEIKMTKQPTKKTSIWN